MENSSFMVQDAAGIVQENLLKTQRRENHIKNVLNFSTMFLLHPKITMRFPPWTRGF